MQVPLAEYDHVVQARPTRRAEQALADWIQTGGARRDLHDFDVRPRSYGVESFSKLLVVVSDEYFGPSPYGVAPRSCWATQASVGQRVTLK
jgi:hypothetical protein